MAELTEEQKERVRVSKRKYKKTERGKQIAKIEKQKESYKKGRKTYNKMYHENNTEKFKNYKQKESYKEKQRGYDLKYRYKKRTLESNTVVKRKFICLSYYSPSDTPTCSVPGCGVSDIDMLCIDHIIDNGADERRSIGRSNLYRYLIGEHFPAGYQTLCANHNLKKEIERRRVLSAGKWGEKPPGG